MMVIDPVCKMTIEESEAVATSIYKGQTYYFCSYHCKQKFDNNPEEFVSEKTPEALKPGLVYTCPMHPEIRQESPGSCPKCGMSLEPITPSTGKIEWICPMHPEIIRDSPGNCPICGMALEPRTLSIEEANSELIDMIKRFKVSVIFTIPLIFITMSEYIPGISLMKFFPSHLIKWIEILLASPVVLWAGWPFFECET